MPKKNVLSCSSDLFSGLLWVSVSGTCVRPLEYCLEFLWLPSSHGTFSWSRSSSRDAEKSQMCGQLRCTTDVQEESFAHGKEIQLAQDRELGVPSDLKTQFVFWQGNHKCQWKTQLKLSSHIQFPVHQLLENQSRYDGGGEETTLHRQQMDQASLHPVTWVIAELWFRDGKMCLHLETSFIWKSLHRFLRHSANHEDNLASLF